MSNTYFDACIFLGDFANMSHLSGKPVSEIDQSLVEACVQMASDRLSDISRCLVIIPGNHDPLSLYSPRLPM